MTDVKNFVSVTDRSTKAIGTATTGLSKVVTELQALAGSSEQIAQEIQFRQGELDNVNAQYDQKVAEAEAGLRIRVLNNEDKVLEGLLKARGLVTITPLELGDLRHDLEAALSNNDQAVAAAVEAAVRDASREKHAALNALESQHKVAIAELNANASARNEKISFLESQVATLQQQIKDERETRLEIAKADAQRQGVVVNNGK